MFSVGLTQNGWTDDLQCIQWFQHTFIPQARAKALTPDEPILLIFDGHGSHLTGELHRIALEYHIHLFMLPAHTTNKTQPLDVGIFGLLSRKWISRNEEIVEETGMGMQKHQFVDEYMAVRQAAITPQIIEAAFRKTGIWPFNPNVFDEEDFAPSRTTSIIAHMPSSYPIPSITTTSSTAGASSDSPSAAFAHYPNPHSAVTPSIDQSNPPLRLPATEECAVGSEITCQYLDQVPGPALSRVNISHPEVPVETSHATQISHSPPLGPHDNSIPIDGPSPSFSSTIIPAAMIPTLTGNTCSHIDKRWSLVMQNKVLLEDICHLEELYHAELARRQALEVQCELARQENGTLRNQLHRRVEVVEGRKRKQLQTEAQFLMSEDALALFAQKRCDAEAREHAEQEKLAEKAKVEQAAADRRARQAMDPSIKFSGSLKGKRKTDLEDIASLLCIPLGGTVPDLIESIKKTLAETATQ